MNARARWLVTATAVFSLTLPIAAHAQEDGWTFRGTGEFGYFFSTRDLGKNVGGLQDIVALQVSSRMQTAPSWAGGIEVVSPDDRTVFRGIVRSTIGGEASATVAICNILEGELCFDRIAGARLTAFHGEVVFVQGDRDDRFRQNFILGAGLRSYQFQVEACDPNANLNQDVFIICELVQAIYEDQAQVQPFIQFGFGFSMESGPVTYFARFNDVVGKYNGGSGNSDGDFQNDIYLTAGLSLRVR